MAIIVGSSITFYPSVLTPTPLSSLGYDSHLVHQTPGICLSTLIASKPSRLWDLSESGRHQVHQNRLLKLAREGSQMTAQHLRDLEPDRRYATLVAVLIETKATIIDQIVDLHDRMIGALFNRAKRAHAEQFQ